MSLPHVWKPNLHTTLSVSTITFHVPDYSDERALIRKMDHHNPTACMRLEQQEVLTNASLSVPPCRQMGHFVRQFNVVTPELSGAWPARLVLTTVKFPSDVLQTEEYLDWKTGSTTERNNWGIISCNYLLVTERRKWHTCMAYTKRSCSCPA